MPRIKNQNLILHRRNPRPSAESRDLDRATRAFTILEEPADGRGSSARKIAQDYPGENSRPADIVFSGEACWHALLPAQPSCLHQPRGSAGAASSVLRVYQCFRAGATWLSVGSTSPRTTSSKSRLLAFRRINGSLESQGPVPLVLFTPGLISHTVA